MIHFGDYASQLKDVLFAVDTCKLFQFRDMIIEASLREGMIYTIGNGGSAATASHLAQDLGKGARPCPEFPTKIRAISLADSVPYITAYGNDEDFSDTYYYQVLNLLRPYDVLVAISGSGKSVNILNAANYVLERGSGVVGLTGFDGGTLDRLSTIPIHVPCNDMGMVEAAHSAICHWIVDAVREKISTRGDL